MHVVATLIHQLNKASFVWPFTFIICAKFDFVDSLYISVMRKRREKGIIIEPVRNKFQFDLAPYILPLLQVPFPGHCCWYYHNETIAVIFPWS